MSLGSHRERCDCTRARVGKEYVDVAMFLFHNSIKAVQIFQARYVACDRCNVSLDEGSSLLQLFLSSPSAHYVGTFFTKRLAVAKPIPLLPPVITAIFPANSCPWLLLRCFFLFVFRCFLC